jgi:carbamate kinase
MDQNEAARRRDHEGWDVVEDAGRGWRRVVASPMPVRVVERDGVKQLIDAGLTVITVGGGGIPVVKDEEGNLRGVAAVIDKDFASSLLATSIGADLLLISTAIEKVALHFGQPDQRWLDRMTVAEARQYIQQGHFAAGSMKPKIEACLGFLEAGGREALITNPENIERALRGETGTRILP